MGNFKFAKKSKNSGGSQEKFSKLVGDLLTPPEYMAISSISNNKPPKIITPLVFETEMLQ